MPMIDLTMPRGALDNDAKAGLMRELTHTLLKWEGAAPGNEAAESIAWTFVHEPELVTVAGRSSELPRYRVVVGVPEGSLDDRTREGLVVEVTDQVLRAESGGKEPVPADARRVWVIVNEIPDGHWGGGGHIVRLTDIMTFAGASEKDILRRTARIRATA